MKNYLASKSFEEHIKDRRRRMRSGRTPTHRERVEPVLSPELLAIHEFYDWIDMRGITPIPVNESGRIRVVQQTAIDDVIYALLLFKENYPQEDSAIFVDLGSNDGRVVAVASALGYRSYGIELDNGAAKFASDYFTALRPQVSSLEHATLIWGDYSNRELTSIVPFKEASVFYNYDDNNVGEIAALIVQHGKPGAFLLLNTYADHNGRIPLRLTAVLDSPKRKYNPPVFDVFQKPFPYLRKK